MQIPQVQNKNLIQIPNWDPFFQSSSEETVFVSIVITANNPVSSGSLVTLCASRSVRNLYKHPSNSLICHKAGH